MPVDLEMRSSLDDLAPVLDSHFIWLNAAVRHIFYPENFREAPKLVYPAKLHEWLIKITGNKLFDEARINQIRSIHTEMLQAFVKIQTTVAQTGAKPTLDIYESFCNLHEEFVLNVRRFEQDCVSSDMGVDNVTHLRNADAMKRDLDKEMERRSRQGQSFIIVLCVIDDFKDIQDSCNEEEMNDAFLHLSKSILDAIRSFDDAYRIADSEFILSLKQTDLTGANAVITRVREKHGTYKIGAYDLSISAIFIEPIPGDSIDDMIQNARDDLKATARKEGERVVMNYEDVSPLQRYVRAIEDEQV